MNDFCVYGGQPLPRRFSSERAARRMMRRYRRLGIQASLYRNGAVVERRDAEGRPYSQAEDQQEEEA